MSRNISDRPCPEIFLELAGKLADSAVPIALKYFRGDIEIDLKSDLSPVTAADREVEAAMRAIINAAFPDHGIFGEEFENEPGNSEYLWVLDPIDGTQSFVTGKPLFGTLIALLQGGSPILGIIDMPALGERWIGASGRQTTFNAKPVWARSCAGLGQAWLYATSPHMFEESDEPSFERLRRNVRRTVYGAECYAYGLVANGTVDLVCEGTMKPYDYMALVAVVQGAGGIIT
ncbi:MAG: inositol monophosphatase family protein, partial [Rhodospirillales bacterium]